MLQSYKEIFKKVRSKRLNNANGYDLYMMSIICLYYIAINTQINHKNETNPNKGNKPSDITTKHLFVYSCHLAVSHFLPLPL